MDSINFESHVYLLDDYQSDEDRAVILRACHEFIFEIELGAWWTDPVDWPKIRAWDLFQKWCDTEFHSVVFDLLDAPLIDED